MREPLDSVITPLFIAKSLYSHTALLFALCRRIMGHSPLVPLLNSFDSNVKAEV